MAGNPDGGSQTVTMEVWWGSELVDTPSFDVGGHTRSDMGRTYHRYSVVATTNVTRFRFKSATGNCCFGPKLDDISLVHGGAPCFISGPVVDGNNNAALAQVGMAITLARGFDKECQQG